MPATFLKSLPSAKDVPQQGLPHIAFVGRSNVGKSSLINHITGMKGLARVSAEPGRTQMINLFDMDGKFLLVDLPGYGYAKTSKTKREAFSALIHDYLWQAMLLKHVFVIIDARHGVTELDQEMMSYLRSAKISYSLVVNKIDKLSRSELTMRMRALEAQFPEADLLPHSNVTGAGKGEIMHALHARLG